MAVRKQNPFSRPIRDNLLSLLGIPLTRISLALNKYGIMHFSNSFLDKTPAFAYIYFYKAAFIMHTGLRLRRERYVTTLSIFGEEASRTCRQPNGSLSYGVLETMRWKSYIITILWIVLLRFLDLYITFRYTPDLECEWNPLVSLFGVSWSGFIATQVLIVLFVATLMFFYFNRKPTKMVYNGLSFDDFIYTYFFGSPRPWPIRMLSFPTNPQPHLVFNGFIFMLMTILISNFAIINNILLMAHVEGYAEFVARYHHIYFPVSFAAILVLSLYTFFAIEYAKYKESGFARACSSVP